MQKCISLETNQNILKNTCQMSKYTFSVGFIPNCLFVYISQISETPKENSIIYEKLMIFWFFVSRDTNIFLIPQKNIDFSLFYSLVFKDENV